MRTLCASVLGFEALVVALAIVPAVTLSDANGTAIVVGGLVVVIACLLAAALLLRSVAGYVIGWVVQVLVVCGGFVLPAMFLLGGLFALLWVSAILLARRADRVVAAKAAAARAAESAGPEPDPAPPAA